MKDETLPKSEMVIVKSDDDIPMYTIFRVIWHKGRMIERMKLYETQDLVQIARTMIEW